LDQTFFGFSPKDKIILHENLFNLIWFGEGRWSWETVYNLPVPIRKLWIKKVNEILDAKQAAAQKPAKSTTPIGKSKTVSKSK
jgi:hypothetical protein